VSGIVSWQQAAARRSGRRPGGHHPADSGMGGGSPAAVAGSANYQKAAAYAQCMRTHGITKFPDPSGGDGVNLGAMRSLGIDINSPQFKSAQQACYPGAGGL
jgi:hypothetical protein